MKKFLAIYVGTAQAFEKSNWNARPEAQRRQIEQEGMRAWAEWGARYQKSILVQGGPLGKTKRIASTGVSDIKNTMTGYVVVQAESHEAAARMFENHPHFAIFPGDSVEVMECTEIPGL
jgi:hypothetical protein